MRKDVLFTHNVIDNLIQLTTNEDYFTDLDELTSVLVQFLGGEVTVSTHGLTITLNCNYEHFNELLPKMLALKNYTIIIE